MNPWGTIGKRVYQIYRGAGTAAMGILAVLVIFVVVMRYCFNVSFIGLEGFITLLFAFTTFWGLGICLLEKEHIVIDALYGRLSPRSQKIVSLINTGAIFFINCAIVRYSARWIGLTGNTISTSLNIPVKYIYGVMPLGFALAAVCAVARFIGILTGKDGRL